MDPDADLSLSSNPVVSSAPPPQSSSRRRKDRRIVSREVALPNSSRRANARKLRNSSDSAANSKKADVSASHSSSSNRRSKKHSSTSSSATSAHRSTTATSLSSERRHHRSSRQSTSETTTRSSGKDSEEHRHHGRNSRHHSSSRSSKQHHRDDNTRGSDDKQSSVKSKSSVSSKSSNDNVAVTKKDSHKSRVSSSSSKHKHTKNGSKDKQSHDDNSNNSNNITYQVFYDEHGRKIKVPTTTLSDNNPTITDTTPTTEMNGDDCGYRSSDFDSDSDPPDQQEYDEYSGSNSEDEIDGASDFDEEEHDSDYIDGASELDEEEEEDGNLDEYEGDDDDYIMVHDHGEESIDNYAGESLGQSNYDDIDTTKSYDDDDEIEEYDDHDDDVVGSEEEQFAPKRSNSPELNEARRHLSHPTNAMEQMVRNFFGDEFAAHRHGDPPTAKVGENESIDNNYDMDPNEDEGATLRMDRPPTPESDRCNEMGDNFSQMSVRGRDPPEEGRGCDPPFIAGSASTSKRLEPRHRNSKKRQPEQAQEKKKPEIKGILKKKEGAAPPPLAYFGKTSPSPSVHSSDSEESSSDSGSDPDCSEVKSKVDDADDDSEVLSLFEDKSVSTAKSGLRSGRFAEANAAAAAAAAGSTLETIDDDDSSSDDEYERDHSTNASTELKKRSNSVDLNTSFPSLLDDDENQFNRNKSHFMRSSDLGLTQDTIFAEQFLDNPESKPEPHYHHPSPHPPPGVQFNCDENWISVDDGFGGHSPIAPQAVDALVATGYRTACDPMMWTPTAKTRKFMTENGLRFDDIPTPAPPEEEGGRGDTSCLVWSGKFPHKHYGHDLPVIRSQGIVNMSPEALVDLLMDSTRVKSYNVSSTGRQDELVLSDGTNLDTCPFSGQRKKKLTGVVIQGAKIVNGAAVGFAEESDNEQSDDEEEESTEMGFDDDGRQSIRSSSKERRKSLFVGVTKLVRSTNKVPMRKSLEYITLLHCRALTDDQGGNGYIIVSRACTPAEDAEKGNKDVQRAETLLNVHIIRRLREKKSKDGTRKRRAKSTQMRNRCLMINVVHVKSPIIPNMLAKKVGLSAASSFVADIRALTEE